VKETGIIMSGDHPKLILEGLKTMTRRVVSPATSIIGEGRVDWSNFCWDGSETFDFGDSRYSAESEYVPDELKGQLIGVKKAPLPFVDGSLEKYHYQYLHVPYRWWDDATIFRIYPKWDVGDRLWVREIWATEKMFNDFSVKDIVEAKVATLPLWYKVLDTQIDREGQERGRWRSSRFCPRWASRITLEITEVRAERLQDITEEDAEAEGMNFNEHYSFGRDYGATTYRELFQRLWDSLNKKRGYGWEKNPWVWVLGFKVIK
jgi:hypothetical protein